MQIDVKIDSSCTEPRVVIYTQSMTDEVAELVKRLSEEKPQILSGFRDDQLFIIEQENIIRIFADSGHVVAKTESGEYTVRQRLYELEERLDRNSFVRISNSEIINLKKARGFDLSLSGTICVRMTDGAETYVSRRYVSKIKAVLGI